MITISMIPVIIGVLTFVGTVIGIYMKLKLDISRLQEQVKNINTEEIKRALAVILSESNYRQDVLAISEKIDKLNEKLKEK